MLTDVTVDRIVRCAGHQGTRPLVANQAKEKFATGSDGSSPSSNCHNNSTMTCVNIPIATINVRTLQDDIKLATIVKVTMSLGIDVLALQELRHVGHRHFVFDDE